MIDPSELQEKLSDNVEFLDRLKAQCTDDNDDYSMGKAYGFHIASCILQDIGFYFKLPLNEKESSTRPRLDK